MTLAAPEASRARVGTPADETQPLEFVRNTADSLVNQRYYRVSTCGRYTVSKCAVEGAEQYDAWRRRGAQPSEHLGMRRTFLGAQNVCQRHAEQQL